MHRTSTAIGSRHSYTQNSLLGRVTLQAAKSRQNDRVRTDHRTMEDMSALAEGDAPPSRTHGPASGLLKKYDIPIHYLDFDYVERCTDARMLERILHVLQSGEEGFYPQLIRRTEECLEKIKPNSKRLRKCVPVLDRRYLPESEKEHLSQDLGSWLADVKKSNEELGALRKTKSNGQIPEVRKSINCDEKPSSDSSRRIKSTDYASWDKYDPDTEILKMDIETEKMKKESCTKLKTQEKRTIRFAELGTKSEIQYASDREREKGNDCYKAEEFKEALEHYTNSINFLPSATNYNNRAMAYIKLKKYKEAISDCNSALKYEPYNVKALLRLAHSYEAIEDYENALKISEETIEIDPNCTIAQNLINKLRKHRKHDDGDSKFRLKITEIDEVPENVPIISNKRNTAKIKPILKRPVILPIPGTSSMPEPYYVVVESKDPEIIQRQEYLINNRPQILYLTNVDTDEEDSDCVEIHIGKCKHFVEINNNENANVLKDDKASIGSGFAITTDNVELNRVNNSEIVVESKKDLNMNNGYTAVRINVNIPDVNDGGGGEPHVALNGGPRIQSVDVERTTGFMKTWNATTRDVTYTRRAEVLRQLDYNHLAEVFGHQLNTAMLRDIICTLYKHFTVAHEVDRVYTILHSLTTVPRFGLNVMFLSQQDKRKIHSIFEFLDQHGRSMPASIKSVYITE